MGNRLTKTDSLVGNDTLTYNNANMLLSRNGGSYTSDANGNTLSGGGRANTWDSQNRLVQSVNAGNGKTSAMAYGADGLRRKTLVTNGDGSQSETQYLLDGQNAVRELVRQRASVNDAWGAQAVVNYLQGPNGPLYRRPQSAADVRWYVYDGLGSVVGEVDLNGSVTSSGKYDVYGAKRGGTGTASSRHGWVGQLGHTGDEETGLVYMGSCLDRVARLSFLT
jgi:hypothetical protein